MKSWICSKCGGGRYFGILHNCKSEPGNVIPINLAKPCPDCGHKFKNVNDYFEHECYGDDYMICHKCGGERWYNLGSGFLNHKCKEREVNTFECRECKQMLDIEQKIWFGPICKECFKKRREAEDKCTIYYHGDGYWKCHICGERLGKKGQICPVPKHTCPPTHTVELTEKELAQAVRSINEFREYNVIEDSFNDKILKSVLAKLKPKKESVAVEIPDSRHPGKILKIHIYSERVLISSFEEYRTMEYARTDFERIYAAYHAHVDEVK